MLQTESAVIDILADVAPEVLTNVASVAPDPTSADVLTVETSSGDVKVASDPADDLSLVTSVGVELAVSLPNGGSADDAEAVRNGIVSFDNNDGSISVPVVKVDGSVQVNTIISGADAPERYPYDITLPPGATLQPGAGGGIAFIGARGEFIGGLAPPWAKDAADAAIPTRYEISGGTTVVQLVEHRSAGAQYPVVADPWLGGDLFDYTGYNRRGTYLGQITVSAKMSPWGWYWYTTGGGAAILAGAGWSELSTKRPRVREKASLKHQYDCHVTFGYAVWLAGFNWDLEKARPNKANWFGSALSHRCNW